MEKLLLSKGALIVGAAVSLLALIWLVSVDRRPLRAYGRSLLLLGLPVASGGPMLLWSTIIGLWSRTHMWMLSVTENEW
jgi:hypothetical protein